ncbi:MAG: DUF6067 family protein, partial [Gemmatimonadetes bacterium]|nr:DUF6067 family protein [Gemmatimonadota bacterium]
MRHPDPRSPRRVVSWTASAVPFLCVVFFSFPAAPVGAQQGARAWQGTFEWPAYAEGDPDPNPPFDFFGQRRVNYPYTIRDDLTNRRRPHTFRALFLENEYLKCTILPDVGGHLYSCTDKLSGREMFYDNPSLKLTQIGYRGAWAAFGVEFNFPVSHNWMSTSPVDFAVRTLPDGSASAWVGNVDRVTGMQWTVELTLRPGRAALEQKTILYNPGSYRHRFYWWTNAAVRVNDSTRIVYPMKYTASHGFRDVDTWPVDSRGTDNSVVGNHRYGPVSRFAYGSREPWMAIWHPQSGTGVVHYSSPIDLPAKKIWSWGGDASGLAWRRALSDDNSAYVEIQAGLFRNQETYAFLQPEDRIVFRETWLPVRGLGGVTEASDEVVAFMSRGSGTAAGADQPGAAPPPSAAIRRDAMSRDSARTRSAPGVAPGTGDAAPTGPLHVAVNVAQARAGARVEITVAGETLVDRTVDLSPAVTFAVDVPEAPAPATLEIADADGTVLFRHTEGVYDFVPDSTVEVGPVAGHAYPADTASWSDDDFLGVGDDQERDGLLLDAWETYQRGLAAFPSSVGLSRAQGRLAVVLGRPADAVDPLSAALERVSNDAEAWYYLGHARLALGDTAAARLAWEQAQQFGPFRAAALVDLAGLAASSRDSRGLHRAVRLLDEAVAARSGATQAGALKVALLRALGREDEALAAWKRWSAVDPTSSFLRHEGALLGVEDDGLAAHLAADPERILDVVEEYIDVGLDGDALGLLQADYPRGPEVVTEPGMPHPSEYPLLAYYKGWLLGRMGRNAEAAAAYAHASAMPTRYVFPHRARTESVLRAALRADPGDATAHFLLGERLLDEGRADQAMAEWEQARRLRPSIPTLQRDMGRTLLAAHGDPARAAALFTEGMRYDESNVDLYFGRDSALVLLGRGASERADSLLRYPVPDSMPAKLVYHLAEVLTAAGRFDEAEGLFRNRFFPSEEGGTDVRQVWLDVRVGRARGEAAAGRCASALKILDEIAVPTSGLDFTADGLEALVYRDPLRSAIQSVRERCPLGEVDGIPRRTGQWDPDTLGNHRAVVRVDQADDAVGVLLPWRRRDADPGRKDVVVADATTGARVRNVARLVVTDEEGRIAFQPTSGPGTYYVYWLPHDGIRGRNYPKIVYDTARATADQDWMERNGLGAWGRSGASTGGGGRRGGDQPADAGVSAAWSRIAHATVMAFEAADVLNSFYPMEVPATRAERERVRATRPGAPFLLFSEDRARPIWMEETIPEKWADDGAGRPLEGSAQQGEYWVFQVGVWAQSDLQDVAARVSDFVRQGGGGFISGSSVSAFNLRGVDSHGGDFTKRVDVPAGRVQALWFGVPIPEDATPGDYEATVSVGAQGEAPREVSIHVQVEAGVIAAQGDDDPSRLSRLRWLDSRICLDDSLVAPYTAVDAEGSHLAVLGRTVDLAPSGFPARIESFFTPEMTSVGTTPREILAAPVALVVEDTGGSALSWHHEGVTITDRQPGAGRWQAHSEAGPVEADVAGDLDFDGTMEFQVTLGATRDASLSDVRLEIPVTLDVARYLMGLGFKGGVRPSSYDWVWNVEHNQDGAWIGDVNAGLQFMLRDDHYVRPLNTNFYLSKPLVMPRSWANDGKGGCHLAADASRSAYMVRCYSGARTMRAGETLRYDVRLTVTPFKPVDTDAQWSTRYFHRFESLDSIQATGANTVNVHHA